MADYTIERRGDGLEIVVTDVGDDGTRLLAAFEDCRRGKCDCPTDEYEKLSELSLETDTENEITLRLVPKSGTRFEEAEIDACLLHTVHEMEE